MSFSIIMSLTMVIHESQLLVYYFKNKVCIQNICSCNDFFRYWFFLKTLKRKFHPTEWYAFSKSRNNRISPHVFWFTEFKDISNVSTFNIYSLIFVNCVFYDLLYSLCKNKSYDFGISNGKANWTMIFLKNSFLFP